MLLRRFGSRRGGDAFDQATILAVWFKATAVSGVNPMRRIDACGAWIDFEQYGVCTPSGSGWEIDHIIPVSLGGTDDLANLQPLQWQNNRHKGDTWPGWHCLMHAAA